MFKKLLVLFCFLLLVFLAYATVYIVEPVDRKVLPIDSDIISFGRVARGETLKVVVKKKSDLEQEWTSIKVDEQLLPDNWKVETVDSDKTLISLITVPKNAEISTQRIKFIVGNQSGQLFDEIFHVTVSTKEGLLNASIENLNQNSVLGRQAEFVLILNNDSIAEHGVFVESSLPDYWFMPKTVQLQPLETRSVELPVIPRSYGEKNFSFTVKSTLNDNHFNFPAKLNVVPTLSGMFQSGIAGFGFFSLGLLPGYLINGFLSLFG